MDHFFQLVTIGNSSVGKTSLIKRFFDNTFSYINLPTIGVLIQNKTITIEGETVKVTLQDTGGQERFKSVSSTYYKKADGVIICFSLIDRKSFDKLDDWLVQMKENASPDICLILAGCKEDLKDQRKVSYDEALGYAEKNEMCYIETSSQSGYNVKEMFEMICWTIKEKGAADKKQNNKPVVLNKNTHMLLTKESSCPC